MSGQPPRLRLIGLVYLNLLALPHNPLQAKHQKNIMWLDRHCCLLWSRPSRCRKSPSRDSHPLGNRKQRICYRRQKKRFHDACSVLPEKPKKKAPPASSRPARSRAQMAAHESTSSSPNSSAQLSSSAHHTNTSLCRAASQPKLPRTTETRPLAYMFLPCFVRGYTEKACTCPRWCLIGVCVRRIPFSFFIINSTSTGPGKKEKPQQLNM